MRSLLRKAAHRLARKYATPEIMVFLKSQQAHRRAKHGQPFPHKNVHVANSVPTGTVLILSPHPDDEAIGAGGVLNMHLTNGSNVTVLYLTDGSAGDQSGELAAVRRKEAVSITETYRFEQVFWEHRDMSLGNDAQTVSALVALLQKIQPETIYLPSFFDHHFDHFTTNQILVEALKQMPAGQFTLYGYEVWDNMPFPNHIVDISDHFDKKADILSHYQTPLQATDFIQLCRYRDALHYTLFIDSRKKKSEGYAEAFYRFDAQTYINLYEQYLEQLQVNGSLLPENVMQHEATT